MQALQRYSPEIKKEVLSRAERCWGISHDTTGENKDSNKKEPSLTGKMEKLDIG